MAQSDGQWHSSVGVRYLPDAELHRLLVVSMWCLFAALLVDTIGIVVDTQGRWRLVLVAATGGLMSVGLVVLAVAMRKAWSTTRSYWGGLLSLARSVSLGSPFAYGLWAVAMFTVLLARLALG